jgi:GDP-L-fucose synthase
VSEPPFRIEGRQIWIAGHRGVVRSALMRRLGREDCELVTVDRDQVDLRRQAEVQAWMHEAKPEVVILAEAKPEVVILAAARVSAAFRRTPAARPISSMTTSPCRPTLCP